MKCRFCEIVKGNADRALISQSKHCISFLSNPYLMRGHSLVIPKKHYESLIEMPSPVLHDLIDEIKKLEKRILKFSDGVTIVQNFLPFVAEKDTKVDHVHFHLWPRTNFDNYYKKVLIHQKKVWKKVEIKKLNEIKKELF
ncbi:MAG: HIT family protein [archaeon]|nr:HIT family protein [archaeon]